MYSIGEHSSSECDEFGWECGSEYECSSPWLGGTYDRTTKREYEYAEPQPYFSSIVESLKSVKRPESYATGGEFSMPTPAISLIIV